MRWNDSLLLPYRVGVDGPFGEREAIHLLHRTEFAATEDRLKSALRQGIEATLDRVMAPSTDEDGNAAMGLRLAFAEDMEGVQAWWIRRMIDSPRPWSERMALFWHDHFACSESKVRDLASLVRQNLMFLECGGGSFARLLDRVMRDVAMLFFLDNNQNSRFSPNENLARELFELFTLGIDNFSESDVREAARALTGWHVVGRRFGFREYHHDTKPKKILGVEADFGAEDLIRLCLDSDHTARLVAGKLCEHFIAPVRGEGMIESLAGLFRKSELDVNRFMRRLFASRLFFGSANPLIKSPVELVVSACRSLEIQPDCLDLARRCSELGEALFEPPSVAGWERGEGWLSSGAMLLRQHLAHHLGDATESRGAVTTASVRRLYLRMIGVAPDGATLKWLSGRAADEAGLVAGILELPEAQTW